MPIYSETLKDDTILDLLENKYQNILIVGCGACMNESLAFKYNYPLFIKDDYGNQISYAVFKELSRITNMLTQSDYLFVVLSVFVLMIVSFIPSLVILHKRKNNILLD